MNRSLSELVDNLSKPGKNIPNDVFKERFYNTYQLYFNSNKKFVLLLRKGVYPYEYPPGLSWHSCLKKTGVKLELLTDNNMLLQFEKGIRGGIATVVHKYAKANNKYMKNYDSAKQSTYLMYVDANNFYRYAMSKKLPVDNFKWETNLSIFTEDFIKNYDE